MKLLQNVWNWTRGHLIGEVPDDDALCAFDCRKPQCTEGEWESCVRRLESVAERSMHAKRISSQAATE